MPLVWPRSIVSPAGAVGVLQTLPSTRKYVETVLKGSQIPQTVDGDVEVGVLYLKHLLDVFHGNEALALAGWYAPAKNGATIILVHGSGGSRAGGIKSRATMFARHGFEPAFSPRDQLMIML